MFENEQLGGTLVASFGANILSDEVISKISQLIGNDTESTPTASADDKQQYEAKLKLLRMRGMYNGH